jgi:hypothetical protein
MLTSGATRVTMIVLAVVAVSGGPVAATVLGTRVVRWLTRSCRGRPIQLSDVRVVRNG